MESRAPSGLFPSGPPRPAFREAHPIRASAFLAGAGLTSAWFLAFGLLATSTVDYLWLSLIAALIAWLAVIALARLGDRGAAGGAAIVAGLGLAIAIGVLVVEWISTGWPLW